MQYTSRDMHTYTLLDAIVNNLAGGVETNVIPTWPDEVEVEILGREGGKGGGRRETLKPPQLYTTCEGGNNSPYGTNY